MAVRLGNVIYWVCCGMAGLWLAIAIFGVGLSGADGLTMFVTFAPPPLFWLIGRGCRYVLAGY